MIEPSPPRAVVSEDAGHLRITIPARRFWPAAIFMAVWLCGWVIGEVAGLAWAIGLFIEPHVENLFALVWLTFWTAAGGLLWQVLLWQLSGREILIVDDAHFIHLYQMRLFSHQREFELRRICRLRVAAAPVDTDVFRPRWLAAAIRQWGTAAGYITLDYAGRTCGAGVGLDEAEARHIVAALLQRHPGLASEHER